MACRRISALQTIAVVAATMLVSPGTSVSGAEPLFRQSGGVPSFLSERSTEHSEIETDRDSFTPATSTVARGHSLFESAWSFVDNRDVQDTHSLPEALLRVGVTDWLELRLGSNYEIGGAPSVVSSSGSRPEGPASGSELEEETTLGYGAKMLFSEQSGWVPQSALIAQATTPVSGIGTATRLKLTWVAGWELSNGCKWDSAIRYGTGLEEGDHFNVWAPSSVFKIPVGEKCNAHIEYFGAFSDGRSDESVRHFVSPGLHYLITEDFEVGFRVGWGLNDESADFFSNIGFGWQI